MLGTSTLVLNTRQAPVQNPVSPRLHKGKCMHGRMSVLANSDTSEVTACSLGTIEGRWDSGSVRLVAHHVETSLLYTLREAEAFCW